MNDLTPEEIERLRALARSDAAELIPSKKERRKEIAGLVFAWLVIILFLVIVWAPIVWAARHLWKWALS